MEGYCRHCGQHGKVSRRGVCPRCAEIRIRANLDQLRQKRNATLRTETEESVTQT